MAEQEMLRGGASGRWFRVWGGGHGVGDKGAGGLRVRLKGKAGDLGGARSGKAGEDRRPDVARPVERGGRKEGGGRAPTGGVVVSEDERGRARAGLSAERGGGGLSGAGRGEIRAGRASWAACGRGKREWAAGRTGPLGWHAFLFPFLFFSKPTQIYFISNQI
jgi:hypothetical protein